MVTMNCRVPLANNARYFLMVGSVVRSVQSGRSRADSTSETRYVPREHVSSPRLAQNVGRDPRSASVGIIPWHTGVPERMSGARFRTFVVDRYSVQAATQPPVNRW